MLLPALIMAPPLPRQSIMMHQPRAHQHHAPDSHLPPPNSIMARNSRQTRSRTSPRNNHALIRIRTNTLSMLNAPLYSITRILRRGGEHMLRRKPVRYANARNPQLCGEYFEPVFPGLRPSECPAAAVEVDEQRPRVAGCRASGRGAIHYGADVASVSHWDLDVFLLDTDGGPVYGLDDAGG